MVLTRSLKELRDKIAQLEALNRSQPHPARTAQISRLKRLEEACRGQLDQPASVNYPALSGFFYVQET